MPLSKRMTAELFGTFWLVFGGCGAAVISAAFPGVGIGLLGVAFAFGLTVLTMAFAIGHISGCHLNPAVTWVSSSLDASPGGSSCPTSRRRSPAACGRGRALRDRQRQARLRARGGFAANGYSEHSPGGYSMVSALIAEITLTFAFLFIILGSTDKRAPAGFAPIAIGLGLTLIHLISIPVTNTSVNPARSTGPALFAGEWALAQLWLFWVAPIAGAVIAGLVYPAIFGEAPVTTTPAAKPQTPATSPAQ